jgi:hypothetical protein
MSRGLRAGVDACREADASTVAEDDGNVEDEMTKECPKDEARRKSCRFWSFGLRHSFDI